MDSERLLFDNLFIFFSIAEANVYLHFAVLLNLGRHAARMVDSGGWSGDGGCTVKLRYGEAEIGGRDYDGRGCHRPPHVGWIMWWPLSFNRFSKRTEAGKSVIFVIHRKIRTCFYGNRRVASRVSKASLFKGRISPDRTLSWQREAIGGIRLGI